MRVVSEIDDWPKPLCACILVLMVSNGCPTSVFVAPYIPPTAVDSAYSRTALGGMIKGYYVS